VLDEAMEAFRFNDMLRDPDVQAKEISVDCPQNLLAVKLLALCSHMGT
jgi:hypothetical protein